MAAGTGTVSDPVIEATIRPSGGHDSVIKMGRVRIKSTATMTSEDFDLRTIKTAVFSASDGPVRSGGPPVVYGSVTVGGSLGDSVRVRSFRGSLVPHTR